MLPRARAGRAKNKERVLALFPVLAERARQAAGTLSGGEQQMLAIGRCLMGAPDLIMFDEPSLGLAPAIIHDVLNTIRELNRDGLTCLLVEQNVAQSLKLASRAYVLENGRVTLRVAAPNCRPTTASAAPIWGLKSLRETPQPVHDDPECGEARGQRRHRKSLTQPGKRRCRRRLDIRKRGSHGACHLRLGRPLSGAGPR